MKCLRILKEEIKITDYLDKELVLDLWTICHYSKSWGTDPEGMIGSNNLITDEDLKELGHWINQISYKISFWLEGLEDED